MAHLTSDLSDELVQILVSPRLKEYSVHKNLIRSICPFFDNGFDGRFRAGMENKMFLPEDDPDTFGIFVNWMYARHLRHDLRPMQIINVCIFAQKYQCQKLKNDAMDALQDALFVHIDFPVPLNYEEVARIFDDTIDIPNSLQYFAVALLAWEISHGDPSNMKYLERILREVDDSLMSVLKYSRDNEIVSDPRIRGDEFPICAFHDHTGDSQSCASAPTVYETYSSSSSTSDPSSP
ncbi:hypothetical protein EYC84_005413 [Monilinia fructicola]|uniref:BTB domain-containing protein n=1 Tax=Monilinia fructicola TaxID=38448 RepID=A0A5M9JYX5_MONFR|nr:hypothetical protein EYC84_005413 [Monilinia fructicola]